MATSLVDYAKQVKSQNLMNRAIRLLELSATAYKQLESVPDSTFDANLLATQYQFISSLSRTIPRSDITVRL